MKIAQKLAASAVLGLGVAAAPMAFAQQGGLVNVNIEDTEILNELQLAAPITVQVPIGIAATVCGVQANVLAAAIEQGQDVECDAENNTQAFSRAVARNTQ